MDLYQEVAEIEMNHYEMLAVEKAVAARVRSLEGQTSLASQMELAALESFAAKLDEELPRSLKGEPEAAPAVELDDAGAE